MTKTQYEPARAEVRFAMMKLKAPLYAIFLSALFVLLGSQLVLAVTTEPSTSPTLPDVKDVRIPLLFDIDADRAPLATLDLAKADLQVSVVTLDRAGNVLIRRFLRLHFGEKGSVLAKISLAKVPESAHLDVVVKPSAEVPFEANYRELLSIRKDGSVQATTIKLQPSADRTIAFLVRDGITKKAISGKPVRLTKFDDATGMSKEVARGTTDKLGYVKFTLNPKLKYTLSDNDNDGERFFPIEILLSERKSIDEPWLVSTRVPTVRFTIHTKSGSDWVGWKDATGALALTSVPLAGSEVSNTESYERTVDVKNGVAVCYDLPAGKYQVRLLQDRSAMSECRIHDGAVLEVVQHDKSVEHPLRLLPPEKVDANFIVTDSTSGKEIVGARLTLASRMYGYTKSDVSDLKGMVRFADAIPSAHLLSVEAKGYASKTVEVNIRHQPTQTVQVSRARTLRISLHDVNGKLVSRAMIAIAQPTERLGWEGHGITDDRGEVVIGDVADGKLNIIALSSREQPSAFPYYIGSASIRGDGEIKLVAKPMVFLNMKFEGLPVIEHEDAADGGHNPEKKQSTTHREFGEIRAVDKITRTPVLKRAVGPSLEVAAHLVPGEYDLYWSNQRGRYFKVVTLVVTAESSGNTLTMAVDPKLLTAPVSDDELLGIKGDSSTHQEVGRLVKSQPISPNTPGNQCAVCGGTH